MQLSARSHVLAAMCCAIVSGCNASNEVPPEVVRMVADQAAKLATLEIDLRDSRKSLAELADKLKDANARLASCERAEALSSESALSAKESLRKAVEQNDMIQQELGATARKLMQAQSQLAEIQAKREQRAKLLSVVGKWEGNFGKNEIEFREDGTAVYGLGREKSDIHIDYSLRYGATTEPGVYNLVGVAKGKAVTGLF